MLVRLTHGKANLIAGEAWGCVALISTGLSQDKPHSLYQGLLFTEQSCTETSKGFQHISPQRWGFILRSPRRNCLQSFAGSLMTAIPSFSALQKRMAGDYPVCFLTHHPSNNRENFPPAEANSLESQGNLHYSSGSACAGLQHRAF